jgi:hypothetical protein
MISWDSQKEVLRDQLEQLFKDQEAWANAAGNASREGTAETFIYDVSPMNERVNAFLADVQNFKLPDCSSETMKEIADDDAYSNWQWLDLREEISHLNVALSSIEMHVLRPEQCAVKKSPKEAVAEALEVLEEARKEVAELRSRCG